MLILSALYGQTCYWHSFGSGGQSGLDNGSTIGQAMVAHFAHGGDSISYGFWEVPWDPIICISLDNYSWHICDETFADTTDLGETVNMLPEDVITISNCSNCMIDYGMYWNSEDPSSVIQIGYTPREDRGVIRAQIRDDFESPIVYSGIYDYMKSSVSWADNDVFGPNGYNVNSGEMTSLWFQFIAPVELTDIDAGLYRIPVILVAKVTMP